MKFKANVYEPMYDFNDKKYIRLTIPPKASEIIRGMHTSRMHFLINQNVDDPLDGHVLTVKVPFRYRRVMCEVNGRPVQSLEHTLETENLLGHLLNVHLKLLDVLFNVDDRHLCTHLKFVPFK